MMKKITAVTGNIQLEEAGLTSMHEHLLGDMGDVMQGPFPEDSIRVKPENMASLRSGLSVFSKECSIAEDLDYAVAELSAYKCKVGGGTICEASPIGMRGNVEKLRKASEKSGVNLVCCTGLYLMHRHPVELADKKQAFLQDVFSREIEEGINGTQVHPGFVKCALGTLNESGNALHERELISLRACADTAKKYDYSLHIHTAAPMTQEMVLDAVHIVLDECDLNPDKLVMLHMDSFIRVTEDIMKYVSGEHKLKGITVELPEKILKLGVNIGFDSWGTPFETVLPDDFDRAKGLIELLKSGYEDHIVLGHDVISKAAGITMGYYGFNRFAEFIPSMLGPLGYNKDIIQKLMVGNPARILAH